MKFGAKIGIIGSGIGGLAAAVQLASRGYEVQLFEKEAQPGGKIAQFRKDGFRFDMGPSLFTLPSLLDEVLQLDPKSGQSDFSYRALDVICRYFYPDDTFIDAYRDTGKFAEEIEVKTGVPAEKVRKYLRQSAEIYDLTKDVFIFNDLKDLRNFINIRTLRSLLQAWKLKPFKTLHEANHQAFHNAKVVQLFDRFATYNGSNPFMAPATLKVIPHLEHNIGAYFPSKGMYSIVEKLVQVAERSGVEFHFSEEVRAVDIQGGKFRGIETAKGSYSFDALISDTDVNTFGRLTGQLHGKRGTKENRLSSSAIIFYWGMKISQPDLKLHNILFSGDYQHEFDCIFHHKTITDDPTIYIFISSREVPEDAPPGHENWYVMINAPENNGQDWDDIVDRVRENILKKINRMLHMDLKRHLLFERVTTPATIEKETGSYRGALYGMNSNSITAAFRRHPNYLRSVKGLYFVGGSVHPGGGIPLCLASARIVADQFPENKPEK